MIGTGHRQILELDCRPERGILYFPQDPKSGREYGHKCSDESDNQELFEFHLVLVKTFRRNLAFPGRGDSWGPDVGNAEEKPLVLLIEMY